MNDLSKLNAILKKNQVMDDDGLGDEEIIIQNSNSNSNSDGNNFDGQGDQQQL